MNGTPARSLGLIHCLCVLSSRAPSSSPTETTMIKEGVQQDLGAGTSKQGCWLCLQMKAFWEPTFLSGSKTGIVADVYPNSCDHDHQEQQQKQHHCCVLLPIWHLSQIFQTNDSCTMFTLTPFPKNTGDAWSRCIVIAVCGLTAMQILCGFLEIAVWINYRRSVILYCLSACNTDW